MENLLTHYMEERFRHPDKALKLAGQSGPVVTISRQAGCSGNTIANKLMLRLNRINLEKERKQLWKVVNKEIIESAARELELHPSRIQHVFKGRRKGLLDEMILSMSTKYYKSDRKIIKIINEVISSIANEGYVIIVGRGGVAITKDHPQALHIKIQAPEEWRIDVIAAKHQISKEEARKYVVEVDRYRGKLLEDFQVTTAEDELFDVILNAKRLSDDELVESMIHLLGIKNLI